MKTLLFISFVQVFLGFSWVSGNSKKTPCPNFKSSIQRLSYHSTETLKLTRSHPTQLKRNKSSTCAKKRRTGEVIRFLKID